ncbi:cilia- and flagella-associated protein 77 [Poeciliopsis prolifica]|uniref:cilia- and flagella-associated protein 77 n=1 Tax=Poeciliopsis prolifica TaxID=188132 RepID=UPI00241361B6|nr:cilia- and flagella-associated protein 77 [Poeciliopsis prolifica]
MNSSMIASPRLGVFRESMLRDPLLIKAPLGRARSRGLNIPGPDFTYGASTMMKDGSVAEALSSWQLQTEAEEAVIKVSCPNFVALNRDAVRSGLVTAKELRQYRIQVGDLQIQAAEKQQHCRTSRRPHLVPDITFGIRNRPSSPLADVLAHHYGHRWLEEQMSRNRPGNLTAKQGRAAETRTSLLRSARTEIVEKKDFTLPQFSQIPAALDTFRDPAARERAASAQQQNR